MIRLHLRAHAPLVGSPASIGNEIRRGCQFIHSLFRSLGHLPAQCPFHQPPPFGVEGSVAMAFLLGPGKVVRCNSYIHFWASLGTLMGRLMSCIVALSLNGFPLSTTFSERFPTWSVTHHSSSSPVVGPGPGLWIHFPDGDPVEQRPAKRFRITGKSSAYKRYLEVLGVNFQRLSDGKG